MFITRAKLLRIAVAIFFLMMAAICEAKTIEFSNLTWQVRDGVGNPGPNVWSSKNAWVDAYGWLHLKISHKNNQWICPLLYTDRRLGFGSYSFFINGRLDKLDPNVVLALFNYPTADIGQDETNEIDIELSKWGDNKPLAFNTSYSVWPTNHSVSRTQLLTYAEQQNNDVIHAFVWNDKNVLFLSANGNDRDFNLPIASWNYVPTDYLTRIPQQPMPVYLSLHLLKGVAPQNGKNVEIIIKRFCFTSIDGKENTCR